MPAQALQEVRALLVVRDCLGAHDGHISADGHHHIRVVDICACRVHCPEGDHLLRHISRQSHTVTDTWDASSCPCKTCNLQ